MSLKISTNHLIRKSCLIILVLTLSWLGGLACDPDDSNYCGDSATAGDIYCACGNGVVEPGEECDDGNYSDSDNCIDTCDDCCFKAYCGDGHVNYEGNEECDYNNYETKEYCDEDCKIIQDICGNGLLESGEECDDGNVNNGDGCSADCQEESSECGNGIVELDEQCDDGNYDKNDSCPKDCQMAFCGDGFIHSGVEACDDANQISGDGCNNCQLEWFGGSCGNGQLDPGETCDDGNNINDDGCDQDCQPSEIKDISVGDAHTCVILPGQGESSQVKCWGKNYSGQLGVGHTESIGDNATPAQEGKVVELSLPNQYMPIKISSGDRHTCMIASPGKNIPGQIYCWGWNGSGQLGLGHDQNVGTLDSDLPISNPVTMVDDDAIDVCAGGRHSCMVNSEGKVRCWGEASGGQLGYGNTENLGDDEIGTKTHFVKTGPKALQISCGQTHTCALLEGGTVRCWGYGGLGALGNGNDLTIGDNEFPFSSKILEFDQPAVQISIGAVHSCALIADGRVKCWGYDSNGVIGLAEQGGVYGDDEEIEMIPYVPLGEPAIQIAAGGSNTCAVLKDGWIKCWGDNSFGQLGQGNTMAVGWNNYPKDIGSIATGVKALKVDANLGSFNPVMGEITGHVCMLSHQGKVRCWGLGENGRLGYGEENNIGDLITPLQYYNNFFGGNGDIPLF